MIVNRAVEALNEAGIETYVFEKSEEAKEDILKNIPLGAEIMNMTSVTLETMGLAEEFQAKDKYKSVRKKLESMTASKELSEMKKIGSAPEWVIGSVHAVTEDGKILIASNTGSQLPAYAYGALNVIFVIGTQKIVKDIDEAFTRIYEYCLPLESERAKKAYGAEGSAVNKILIINKELSAGRIKIYFIKEVLGF